MLDAVLVSLADHGLTPIALSARLTYTGAPESLQGAIAAGLLGGGSVFLGVVEDTARFLEDLLASPPADLRAALAERRPGARARPSDPQGRGPAHAAPVRHRRGVRHPRPAPAAAARGRRGARASGLPINGAGVAGAALADIGFRSELLRGFALLARTAGLLGHLAEEMDRPLGMPLYREIDGRAVYEPPEE